MQAAACRAEPHSYVPESRGGRREYYVEHICRSLLVLKRAVWPVYGAAFARAVRRSIHSLPGNGSGVNPFEVAALIVAGHDLGKLAHVYQEQMHRNLLRSQLKYRHEVLSAPLVLRAARMLYGGVGAALDASAAVLLHHEPLSLSALAGELGYEAVRPHVILKTIAAAYGGSSGKPALKSTCAYEAAPGPARKVAEIAGKRVVGALREVIRDPPSQDDIVRDLYDILVHVSVGGVTRRQATRSRIGVMLHTLVLSDAIAAYYGREGGGNGNAPKRPIWIIRRALGLAGSKGAPAELPVLSNAVIELVNSAEWEECALRD